MRHIHVLTTGGTIDKIKQLSDDLVFGPPAFEALLAPVLTDLTFDITPVMALDSLQITDADRAVLCAAVEATSGTYVLITHGTDTMAATAAYLADHLSATARDKVVVLTGAMQPASMRSTDAAYNLGVATAALQLVGPGVHVAMSGRVFAAGSVAKDLARGVFVDAPSVAAD